MRSGTDTVEAASPVRHVPAATTRSQAGAEIAIRFTAKVRRSVRAFIATSPRAADLANVFPGAAYVIATKAAPEADIDKAMRLTLDGAPLRDVARTLGLPLWLRRLPPEAFRVAPGPLPCSEMFTRRIANHLPAATDESAFWLASVAFAAKACDEYFSLWLAAQLIFH